METACPKNNLKIFNGVKLRGFAVENTQQAYINLRNPKPDIIFNEKSLCNN
jgi:hypothetical protein